jgi:hypothetical protein
MFVCFDIVPIDAFDGRFKGTRRKQVTQLKPEPRRAAPSPFRIINVFIRIILGTLEEVIVRIVASRV